VAPDSKRMELHINECNEHLCDSQAILVGFNLLQKLQGKFNRTVPTEKLSSQINKNKTVSNVR